MTTVTTNAPSCVRTSSPLPLPPTVRSSPSAAAQDAAGECLVRGACQAMTSDRDLETVVKRLSRVERELRWWRRLGFLLVAGLLIAPTAQQAFSRSRAVEAERFVVRDEHGNVRAVLGVGIGSSGREESVGLRLVARDGASRGEFFLDVDGTPFLRLQDREGKVALQADVAPNDIPGFVLWGKRRGADSRRATTVMTFGKDDLPLLMLSDQRGNVVWRAP